MPKKKMDYQHAFARLEEIVDALESDETSLENTMALYKEGVGLSVFLGQRLKDAEQEVTLLKQSANGLFLEVPFGKESGESDYDNF